MATTTNTDTTTTRYDSGPPTEDPARPTDASYVSQASTEADAIETRERARDLGTTIEALSQKCATTRKTITSLELHRNGIQQHGRGWPLLAVGLLAIVTVALEYFPATQFSQIFPADDTQRKIYTATFTIVPAVLALALGELLRRRRHPEKQVLMDMILLVFVTLMTVAFLLIGYQLRLAYTTESGTGGLGLTPAMEALALTSIATIGVVLTVVSAYYRESLEMFRVRWKLAAEIRELRTLESHLQANKRDLERAQSALPGNAKLGTPESSDGRGQRNGVAPGTSSAQASANGSNGTSAENSSSEPPDGREKPTAEPAKNSGDGNP
jgi:hypothetical protein